MDRFFQNINIQFLIDKYFDDPSRRIKIKKDNVLLRQNENSQRLYLVLEGSMSGYIVNPDSAKFELLTIKKGMFIGVYSFFSGFYTSSLTYSANEDTLLAYIDKDHPLIDNLENRDFLYEFMPVILGELHYRQQLSHKIYIGKEQTLKELIHTEKMASLGQMAASIAHELNNSITVLKINSEWMEDIFGKFIQQYLPQKHHLFLKGLKEGRVTSSSLVRKTAEEISARYNLPDNISKKLARSGFDAETSDFINNFSPSEIEESIQIIEAGTSFNDMRTAAYHSSHIVKSVKQLGAQQASRKEIVNINETLNESLILLKSNLHGIQLELHIGKLPQIEGNTGEFVQIFSNLIKNASESLIHANTINPLIEIFSNFTPNKIVVTVKDNGPGIPPDILPRIFQPNVTTKVSGLSFGLGIGLTIVERLVKSYNGTINVHSEPGETGFVISIPCGDLNEKS